VSQAGYGPDFHYHQPVGSAKSGSMLPRNIHKTLYKVNELYSIHILLLNRVYP